MLVPSVDTTEQEDNILETIARRIFRGVPAKVLSPLAQFALDLLDEETILSGGLDESLLQETVVSIHQSPHGEEVVHSLQAMARMTRAKNIADIAAEYDALVWLGTPPEEPLCPQVLEALQAMWDISSFAACFHEATNPATQAAAISRAISMLNELSEHVGSINMPERSLLQLAVHRWQSLMARDAGSLVERTLRELAISIERDFAYRKQWALLWVRPITPFINPYKTGDPVHPPLFVGRTDVFNRIQEVWTSKDSPDSIILYGHRRMGKSSILRNLGEYAPAGSLLVYCDLKGEVAFSEGPHYLLRGLADAAVWAGREHSLEVPEPKTTDYASPAKAAHTLRRLLRRVLTALPENASLILALDEFEAVDIAVQERCIGRTIYDYLRSLSQEPHIVLVFAGLHTLDEMSRSYKAAFFGSYVNIHVSYLSPEAAERLITRPTPDFALNYHRAVVSRIIHETHGQPLLVQRICQELVNHVNHELFDLEKEREARVLPEDLEVVLSDEFVQSETRYFEGIWNDQIAGREAVEAVLGALATGKAKAGDIAQAIGIPAAEVADSLEYLKTRDLAVMDPAGDWDLVVPLMRRWLRLHTKQR